MMAPLGVFDSGLGGLTVVAALRTHLPHYSLHYIGDSLHAPYGSRSPEEIQALSLAQARYLYEQHGCGAIVIACNTATAAAAEYLRSQLPIPVIGMEPAVKPAAQATQSGIVGVLATVGTLESARFAALLERFGEGTTFLTRSCPGWVEAVEAGALETLETRALVARIVCPLLAEGADTLVLGCTHFPVLKPLLRELVGPKIALIDTGDAVARRVASLVPEPEATAAATIHLYTTGAPTRFAQGAAAILGVPVPKVTPLFWNNGELVNNATQ